jgi:urease accessory protein
MTSLAEPAMLDQAAQVTGWQARLDLDFRRDGERTVLARRRHFGPLRVQKELHPEGPDVCQAIVVHPPGGIVGGDDLAIGIDVGDRSCAAHHPGATSGTGPRVPKQGFARLVGPMGVLEWLPQDARCSTGPAR